MYTPALYLDLQSLFLTNPASIRNLRQKMEIKLGTLAEACDFSIHTLSSFEHSDTIKKATAEKIARGFIYIARTQGKQDELNSALIQQRNELGLEAVRIEPGSFGKSPLVHQFLSMTTPLNSHAGYIDGEQHLTNEKTGSSFVTKLNSKK